MDFPQYKVPPHSASNEIKLEWFLRALDEGDNFLKTQAAYPKIEEAVSIIMGEPDAVIPKSLSRVQVNFQKRLIHDIVANLANTRPIQGFQCSNRKYDRHADILNKLSINWYHNQSVDRKIRKALQWAAVSTGYLCPVWKVKSGTQGDIELEAKGPTDVMVVQLPASMDLQDAYTVIIKSETPIHLAHSIWGVPEAIQADHSTPTWYRSAVDGLKRMIASPFFKSLNTNQANPTYNTVDIFHSYIMDDSVNRTGKTVQMGDFDKQGKPTNTWSYEVPSLGSQIPTGMRTESGEFNLDGSPKYVDLTRPATEEDCKLYPRRRLIISTRYGILYDGPSFWWHGRVPCVKFTLDDWPWQYLGMPLTDEGSTINVAFNEILRGVVDTVNVSLDPPLAWASGIVAKSDAQSLKLRARGQRIEVNPNYMERVFKTLVDPDYYQISSAIPKVLETLQTLQEYLLNVDNMKALAKNRQVPAADTVEAFNNLAGAITTDRSRIVEAAIEQLGALLGPTFFQFYPAGRRIRTLGPGGTVKDDFDYQPGEMVPQNVPSDFDTNTLRRSKWFEANFAFYIEHGSLHDITSMTQRMTEIQLKRGGAPISWHTIMSHNNIQNVGQLPADPKEPVTEIDKWKAEQKMMAALMMEIQAAAAPQPGATDPQGLEQALRTILDATGNGGNPGVGRKPTAQTPPHQITRAGGDVTMSESR